MINGIQIQLDERLLAHRARIQTLADACVTLPTGWRKTNQQLDDYLALQFPALNNLIEAVIHPDASHDRVLLRALALAEQTANPPDLAAVNNAVIAAVLRKLLDIYAPAAQSIYTKVAGIFDEAAGAFHTATTIVDPERLADEVVNCSEAERTAWTQAPLDAQRLDTLATVLKAAAELAGTNVDTDELLLPLTCDPGNAHRRKTWEAWFADGRCRRWSALAALDSRIRAAALDDLQPYRQPAPIEYVDQTVHDEHGHATVIKRVPVDPEDQPAVEPIDPRRPQGRAVFSQ